MPEPYYADDLVTLHLGDCLDVMAAMPDASVDSVACDPPYGLEFMGREWDSFKPSAARIRQSSERDKKPGAAHNTSTSLVSRNVPDAYVAGQPFQRWCEAWAAECLRVLRPGGWFLAFGGTRTYHRMACAVEDAGFEIRDSLHWVYGSGFPKSLDVSKAIDKATGAEREIIGQRTDGRYASGFSDKAKRAQGATAHDYSAGWVGDPAEITAPATAEAARWSGWGTALKPAHEPIVVARKPLAGTVAGNVLEWGTGALNVDGCRVAHVSDADRAESEGKNRHGDFGSGPREHNGVYQGQPAADRAQYDGSAGRWPPNVLLTHSADCNGTCAPGCPVAGLDGQSGTLTSALRGKNYDTAATNQVYGDLIRSRANPGNTHGDSGGASRFFPQFNWDPEYDLPFLYCAKAPKSERPQAEGVSAHPTVKPLAVMRWLVRLVTPPGGLVLDPFAGTGTTGQACALEGFRCVLAERDPDSAELARVRLAKPVQRQMTLDLPALPTTE